MTKDLVQEQEQEFANIDTTQKKIVDDQKQESRQQLTVVNVDDSIASTKAANETLSFNNLITKADSQQTTACGSSYQVSFYQRLLT